MLDNDFLKGQPWNAYEEVQHMQEEMEHMFDESFSRFHMKTPFGNLTKTADVDLKEKPDSYIITVNAPGADQFIGHVVVASYFKTNAVRR